MINLSRIDISAGRFEDGIDLAHEAGRISRNRNAHYLLTVNQADASLSLGRYTDALRYAHRQLMAALDTDDPMGVAASLQALACAKYLAGVGTIDNSLRMLRAAVRLHHKAGHLGGEAEAHHDAGKLLRLHGDYPAAIAEHQIAFDAIFSVYDPIMQTRIADAYAVTLCRANAADRARAMAERALHIAEQIRLPYRIARAQTTLADCLAGTEPGEAGRLRQRALHTFTQLGAVAHFDLNRRLADLPGR